MDSATQIALMAKATQVFGNNETFLSFPVTPLAFRKQQLDLANDATFNNLIEFSALTNLIPRGVAWSPEGTNYLWDVYATILDPNDTSYALSTRTQEEESEYQAAKDFLFTENADGTRAQSQYAIAYTAYRDLYLQAQQQYLSEKSTVEASTDAEKKQWDDTTGPRLRADMNEAQTRWETEGFRFEVEEARSTLRILGAKSPEKTWQEWKNHFNTDVDTLSRARDQLVVYPTSYVPGNALEDSSWRSFALSRSELDALLAEGNEELLDIAGIRSNESPIESIQFDFSSATLIRPWFSSDVFTSRFWRFAQESRILSDGSTLDSGLCPAYAVAVVFARNVKIKAGPSAPSSGKAFEGFRFRIAPNVVKLAQLKKSSRTGGTLSIPFSAGGIKRVATVGKVGAPTPRPASAASIRAVSRVLAIKGGFDAGSRKQKGRKMDPRANPLVLRSLRSAMFERRATPKVRIEAGQPASTPPPSEPDVDRAIYILALICKPVPKCPDPDPALQW